MFQHPWSHKMHDAFAASVGAVSLAVINLAPIEAWMQIVVLGLTIVFLLIGIAMLAGPSSYSTNEA